MTNDQIINLAKQAGFWEPMGLPSDWEDGDYVVSPQELQRFAELVRNEVLDEVGCALIDNQFVGCHKAVEILRELKS